MADKLAVHGGEAVVAQGAVRPWPHITEEDRAAVLEVMRDGDIGVQREAQFKAFAEEWAQYMGVRFAIPCNSGTAALHMGVAGVGIEPGDEVICPAFTYWASAAAVLHHNGIPVFVDVEPRAWTMDPAQIEARITERTRAIMPVHIHGMPADMDPIVSIARKHNLFVIEDVAQAHGARYKGHLCGAIGDCAGYSLQASKLLTTGSHGGVFTTDDEMIHKRAALLEYLGELVIPGREGREQEYNAYGMGWMYRGDTFGQAFARSQLRRLDENNARRIENCSLLTELLRGVPGVDTPYVPDGRTCVYYTYVLNISPESLGLDVEPPVFRQKVERALQAEGVPVGRWQRMAVPAQEIFQQRVGYGKGCPWHCPHAGPVEYNVADYPVTNAFVATNLYVNGIWPPNGPDLMRAFADAIIRVMSQPDAVLAVDVQPE
ncbi:MAG: DegT/DnrJ/EryC1/StrS family aminotransferase [Armatimonadota bacterium]|nr:MAG: DegT/DnrJ/EryC1/StrS family aminotransferase [Armatimonadota bacterium]